MAKTGVTLSQERLKELLHYDPETGIFTWRVQRGRSPAGSRAGASHHSTYRRVRIDNVLYDEHRLAWLYMTGGWPVEADHRNYVKSQNQFDNLREATRSQNVAYRKLPHPPKSGVRGVRERPNGRWQANITINGKNKFLGAYGSRDEAAEAYAVAAKELFGEFASLS